MGAVRYVHDRVVQYGNCRYKASRAGQEKRSGSADVSILSISDSYFFRKEKNHANNETASYPPPSG